MSRAARCLTLLALLGALPLGGCAVALCREEAPVELHVTNAPAEGVSMVVHHDKTRYDRAYEGLSSLQTTLPRDGTYTITVSHPGWATERVAVRQTPNNVILLDLVPVAAGLALGYLAAPTNLSLATFGTTIVGAFGTAAIGTGLVALGVDVARGYAWTLSPEKTEVRLRPTTP